VRLWVGLPVTERMTNPSGLVGGYEVILRRIVSPLTVPW
jgi:hypothetical protein